MTLSARSLVVRTLLVPLVLFGCGGSDATGPKTGGVVLAVSGLPNGSLADIVVTGPDGFSATVASTDTLEALVPGNYTVEARRVVHGGDDYAATQERQTITVAGARTPMSASVAYSLASGRLTVNYTGLPVSSGTAIVVTGPGGFTRTITSSTQQLSRLVPGTYTVAAGTVTSGLQAFVPDQPSHTVAVAASRTPATVTIAFTPSAGLNLVIDGMHITQSVQRYDGSIPLVGGRDGFLRIFGRANVSNGAVVPVRVRFFMNGSQVSETTIAAGSGSVPVDVDQGSLHTSWNIPVAGTLIQPGLSVLAEIDPANVVTEVSESDNRFPSSGTPQSMIVVSAPVFAIRFVPVRTDSTGLTGNVTEANKHQFMTVAQKIHPIPGYDADVRAPYTTTAPPLQSGNGNGAWGTVLSEVNALRVAEGSSRYYYGVVGTTYNSGVAGIGYVPGRASLGWDKLPSGAGVLAHEIGHNWGRLHAPCGGVANPDAQFPHAGGVIGAFGFDVASGTVQHAASRTDIMGYCSNQWISDYTYLGIMNHRGSAEGSSTAAGQAEAVVVGEAQPSLLVWGRIVGGKVILEPAFEIVTRPVMPARDGPYTVEGTDASGGRVFSISFAGDPVADSEDGERQFAFAIPMSSDRAGRLTKVRAVGQGGGAEQGTAAQGTPEAVPTAQAFAGDRVRVRWNPSKHPMLLVRDAESGEVLSFARGGEVTVKTRERELELVVSGGARSRTRLTKVEAQ